MPKVAKRAGLAAAIWRWLAQILFRAQAQGSSFAAPSDEECLEQSTTTAQGVTKHHAAAEAALDDITRESSPTAIDVPGAQAKDDIPRPAVIIEPRSLFPKESHELPLRSLPDIHRDGTSSPSRELRENNEECRELDSVPEAADTAEPDSQAGPEVDSTIPAGGGRPLDPASLPIPSALGGVSEQLERRPAAKYRPRLGGRLHEDGIVRTTREKGAPNPVTPGSLDADFVVMFRPGGLGIELALLLRRGQAMADEMTVRLGTDSYDLVAVGDDLFEPIAIANPAAALASGVAAASMEDPSVRWVRRGRNLHVFTARAGVAGFVSVPRVVIGVENALFCTDQLADDALRVCAATSKGPPEEVFGIGIPVGWRCFRGIQPVATEVPQDCEGILLALVPLPDAAIDLSGGISISRSAWLLGHPPSIRIVGADALPGSVTIDGRPASCSEAGCWVVAGWDTEGSHSVRYAGLSRAYEISRPPQAWEYWEAHSANGLVLCGALATGSTGRPIFASATGAMWLIGCVPGEVIQADRNKATSYVTASPSFEPVWAVPVPSGRRRNGQFPQLIGRPTAPGNVPSKVSKTALRLWCQVLREGARDRHWRDSDREVASLWMQYRHVARALWRRSR